jgi:CheY-like chemotaxis protein
MTDLMLGLKGKLPMSTIKTLVIVEDEPLIAMDIRQRCEDAGYTVLAVAGTVAQAERNFADHCPDAIVSDMDLSSDGNGCDIVEAIRKRCPDIKVVFVTGTTDPVKLERIAATKPETVLSKPLQPRRLEEALQFLG